MKLFFLLANIITRKRTLLLVRFCNNRGATSLDDCCFTSMVGQIGKPGGGFG